MGRDASTAQCHLATAVKADVLFVEKDPFRGGSRVTLAVSVLPVSLASVGVRRVVQASMDHDTDFSALVLVLAATGAGLDQAARLTVADLQPEAGRIMVPASRKGRGPSRSRTPRCPCRRT